MNKILKYISNNKLELFVLFVVLVISSLAQGINMFHFPYYENDEGTYMSQAWSLLTQGKMAPYTYWYDHAPAGWFLIALWVFMSGGFFTFGMSLNSGRVLMLILHILSTFFVFKISKKFSNNLVAPVIASLIFSLSPLGIYFQRRVLLDNIMTFWVLLAFYLLLFNKVKLRYIFLSALAFGIAILSKENAIFFIPGFIALLYQVSHKYHRRFAIIHWVVIMGSVTSLYFLYAILKGEFFPPFTLFGGNTPHVSLIESIKYQLSRPGGSIFDFQKGLFWYYSRMWLSEDKLLILGGAFGTVILTLLSIRKRKFLSISLLSIGFIYFLMRGGEIIEFYIIPIIPILGITIGLTLGEFLSLFKRPSIRYLYVVCSLLILFSVLGYYALYGMYNRGLNIYTTDQTKSQIVALNWMRKNINPQYVVAIDDYAYIDLHDPNNPSHITFPKSEWYWKLDLDNQIKSQIIDNSSDNIDVIAETPQMGEDIAGGSLPLLSAALKNSQPVEAFSNANWDVQFWKVRYPKLVLKHSWDSYKSHFILSDGRTIDPSRQNATTSEAQSYTLLRAVWMNDRQQFDKSWQWTKHNLGLSDGLFSWYYGPLPNGSLGLKDGGSAADADEDIALALAFASREWHNETYLQEAKAVIMSIWNNEVKNIQGKPYLVAGNWAKDDKDAIINPSYFSPYSYRIFAQIDPGHDWNGLVNSSYTIFGSCSSGKLDKNTSASLMPDWCGVDSKGKITISADPTLNDTNYSFDAFRSTWRIALDYIWYQDPRAFNYLSESNFLRATWSQSGKLTASYTHDGKVWDNYESVSAYGADLGNFLVTDKNTAKLIYQTKILSKFYEDADRSYWDDPNNYYDQNWAWFGTALYSNNLPNLWQSNQ